MGIATLNRLRADQVWTLLILSLAIVAYAPTLGHGFVFDDGIVIVRNPLIRSLSSLPEIFASPEWIGSGLDNHLYRPLTVASYALNYQLSGLSPWSYHLVNLVLHAIVSVLVFRLGLRWRLPIAAAGFGALIFAVHPVHVEAVASVVGRKELLATVFTLTMVLAHPRAVRRGGVWWAVPIFAYAAAMFSKEVGVVGIGMIVIHDWLVEPRELRLPDRRLAFGYGAYASVILIYMIARQSVIGSFAVPMIPFVDNPAAHAPAFGRITTAVAVLGKGLLLQVLPVSQSPDYSYDAIPVVAAATDARFLATIVILSAAGVVALKYRVSLPALGLAVAWYALAILPGSNLLFPVGTLFGERLLYLPSVGVCLVVGLLFSTLWRRYPTRVLRPVVVLALAGLAAGTIRYAQAWSNDLRLFSVAVANVPDSGKAHQKLAEALMDSGRVPEAMEEARRALAISPRYFRAGVLLADAYVKLGRLGEAEREYQHVLSSRANDEAALYGLGRLRIAQGRQLEAGELWRRVLATNPRHAGSLSDLGTLNYVVGDTTQARDYWERAVRADPSIGSAWYNLGLLYESAGESRRAREAYRAFLEVALPDYQPQIDRAREYLDQE